MRTQFFAPAVIVAAASLLNNQADALKLETQAQVMADDYNHNNWSHTDDMGLAGNFGNYGSMGAKGRAVGAANTGLDRMTVPATNPERRGANLGQARSGAPPGDEHSLGLKRKPDRSVHPLGVTLGDRDSFGPITGDKERFGETKAARSLGDLLRVDSDQKTSPAGSGHSLGVTRGNRDSFGPITGDKERFGETKAARSLAGLIERDDDEYDED